MVLPRDADPATEVAVVPDLPDGEVGAISRAYLTSCEADELADMERHTLALLDVRIGRTLRKMPVSGLPKSNWFADTGSWLSGKEVVLVVHWRDRTYSYSYAVDVTIGQARRLADHGVRRDHGLERESMKLPGINQNFT